MIRPLHLKLLVAEPFPTYNDPFIEEQLVTVRSSEELFVTKQFNEELFSEEPFEEEKRRISTW